MNEMTRENARKIDFYGSTLDECVNSLLKFQQRGESVVVEFKGHKLYSCDVTMDGAYQEVLGMTKAEHEQKMEEWRKEYQSRGIETPEEINTHDSKDIRSNLLGGMSMTQSWVTLEDLQTVLPQEQYQEIVTTVRSKLEQSYAKLDIPDVTQEEIDKEIAEDIAGKVFKIGVDEKGGFILQEFALSRDKLTRPINPSQLDATKLASVVEKAMQKYLDYDRFHTNKYLKTEQIPQTLEYYINVAKEYQSRGIETPEEINTHDSKDIRSNLLGGMSMTQSRVTLEDLQTVLPQEQYQEIVTTVRSKLEQRYAKLDIPDVTQEEIDKEIAEDIAGKVFEIGVDEKGGFILQESALLRALSRDKLTRPINPSQLDATKLASVVEKAMQKHLDYDRFHTNKYLKAEQIPQTLEYYINVAKEYQSRGIETPEEINTAETIETPVEERDEFAEQKASAVPVNVNYRYGNTIESAVKTLEDYRARGEAELEELHKADSTKEVPAERRAEEKGIVDSSLEKAQLTSEIDDIEQQLEELRAKEAELKKSLEEKQSKLNGLEEK